MSVTVRRMRWWDIEPVLPLERELFPHDAWSAETFWAELSRPETRHYVVADDGGRVLGYAGVMSVGSTADVQTVAVAPSAQGRGLGATLVRALLDEAARRRCREALLEVRADNGPAQRLYERFGFERVAVRRRYYQPDGVDAHVLRLRPLPRAEAM